MRKPESNADPDLARDLDAHGAVDEGIERWLSAQRWRRCVERVLAPLTLTEWLVLDALARLIRESNDAVSQIQVGRHLEMNKTSVCQAMQRLDRMGLVDQAPEFGGNAYRIYLTEEGKHAARQARLQVDTVLHPRPWANSGCGSPEVEREQNRHQPQVPPTPEPARVRQ